MFITVQQLHQKILTGNCPRLIDVREPGEWEICRLEQATLIPMSQFTSRAPLELEPDEEIVLYCHHGIRSAKAQSYLIQQGYQNVYNLVGGIEEWAQHIDPKMKRY